MKPIYIFLLGLSLVSGVGLGVTTYNQQQQINSLKDDLRTAFINEGKLADASTKNSESIGFLSDSINCHSRSILALVKDIRLVAGLK